MVDTIVNGIEMAAAQKRIWQLQKRYHRSFTAGVCLQVNGMMDKELLLSSLCAITDRHGIFRTDYKYIDATLNYPFQVVADKNLYPSFEYIDLFEKDNEEQEATISKIYQAQFEGVTSQPGFLNAILVKQHATVHTLIVTAPAISADIRSLMNVLDELFKLYTTNSKETDQDDPALQFVQFSEWHNDILAQQDAEADRFWTNRTKHNITATLPLEDAYEGINDRFETIIAAINDIDYSTLTTWCRNKNYTVEDFLLGAWSLLLWQYTGQRDNLLLGKTAVGRTLEEFESINGPFSKTLPFLVNINKKSAFEQICHDVQQESSLINDWQDNFYWKTAEDNAIPGCAFQFEYTPVNAREFSIGELKVQYKMIQSNFDWFKLKLSCADYNDGVQAAIHANTAFFSPDAVTCIKQQFTHLINSVLKNEEQPVEASFAVSPWEKELVLEKFNDTKKEFATNKSLISYIEEYALQNPGQPAVKCGNEMLTYSEFNEKTNQWAWYLSKNYGIGKGDVVAVNLERSVLQLVCLIGILKTGAAYLPTDHAIPVERLRYILEDSNARAIITNRELSSEQSAQARVIEGTATADAILNYDRINTGIQRNAGDIFYVMYTSGSTGKPKGVLVPDSSIINYAKWFQSDHQVNDSDSSVLFSSIAFDLSYTSLWPVLISGGTLNIMEEMPVFDADHLVNLLVEEKVTYIKLTPSHFNLLINSEQFAKSAQLLSLRLIVLGGEPTRVQDIEYYLRYKKDTAFLNHYGPTETTIGVITHRIDTDRLAGFKQKPLIGKPSDNNRVYILNESNEMVPVGVLGEICIAGKNVTKGYLKQPALTDQKFIPDVFTNEGKLYKTGDLGRWTPGGNIEFFGRKDFQVKIHGYRIELEEIEQTLLSYKNITRAYVTVNKDEASLIAFFTSMVPVNIAEVKKFLATHLPDYMMPGTLVELTQFPLLPNGKIDRNTLLNTEYMKLVNDDFVAPQNELEHDLAALWREALETEQVSIHDNFFDVGGNSFKLVKVFREFSKKYPGVISLTDLFKYNTIHSLAVFIDEKQQVRKPDKQNTFSFEV